MWRRRLSLALALACGAVAAGICVSLVARPFVSGKPGSLIAGALAFETTLGILAFAGAALSPRPASARLGLGPGRLPAHWLALLTVGTLAASYGLDGALEQSGLAEHSALRSLSSELSGIRGATLLFAVVGLALAPGLAEELLCRGLFQPGLVTRFGTGAGIAMAAALFGALHAEWIHGIFAGILGLYLGTVSHLTRSVRAPILCHVVNNLAAILTAAFGLELRAGGVAGVAASCGLGLAILIAAWRRFPAPSEPGTAGSGLQPTHGSVDP